MKRITGILVLLGTATSFMGGCEHPGEEDSPATASTAEWTFSVGDATGELLRPLLGVNAGPYPVGTSGNPDLTEEYRTLGVTEIRNHDFYGPLDMVQMYPDHTINPNLGGSFNFEESDVRFQAIVDGGFEPYFRLGDSYNDPTPPSPANLDNYVTAAVNVIRHYREGLWGGFESPFIYVEIWNEPGDHFWPGYSMNHFYTFYTKLALALRDAFPDLKIGGPGWSPAGYLSPTGMERVGSFLDAVKAADAPLDFHSWHVYSNDPDDYAKAADWYREELDARGFTGTESHISEWNTGTTGLSATEQKDLRVNAKGATINTAAWIELQKTDVAVSTFYRGNDTSSDLPAFFGMFHADGTRKKIADAFELWSAMAEYSGRLELTGGEESGLHIIAGRNAEGRIAVLIANTTEEATTYSFESTGTIEAVSDNDEGIVVRSAAADENGIGAHTVHLVLLD